MVFIEASVFTRQITSLLPDDGYRELQRCCWWIPHAAM
jgi:hypothetical protein